MHAEAAARVDGSPAALAVSASQINLSWTDNSTSEDGFKIERCQNANCTNFAEIADAFVSNGAGVQLAADYPLPKAPEDGN